MLCYFSLSLLVPAQPTRCQQVDVGMPRDGQFMGAGCHVGARWDRAGAATKVGTGLGPVVFWGGWWQGCGPVLGPWAAGSGPSLAGLCHERGSPSSSLCPGESRGLSSSRDARSSFAPITECPRLWGPGARESEATARPPSPTPTLRTRARVPPRAAVSQTPLKG